MKAEKMKQFVLHPPAFILISWSGRRDLNSRPSPWQGDALPLSYSRFLRKPAENRSFQSGGAKCTPFCTPLSRDPVSPLVDLTEPLAAETCGYVMMACRSLEAMAPGDMVQILQ